jgi:hypothetical protein
VADSTHHLREQLQLACRTAALTLEARFRQTRFLLRTLDQRVAQCRDAVGDTVKELGTHRQRQRAIRVERLLRQIARLLDLLHATAAENRLGDVGARSWIERVQRLLFAAHRLAADQHFAGNQHFCFP